MSNLNFKNNQSQERFGEIKKNNQGSYMKIINYKDANNIDIEFLDNFHYVAYNVRYRTFKSGSIKNPYHPSVFGVGIIGDKYSVWENGKPTKEYKTWKCVLKRCFDTKTKEQQPTYKDVLCCKEWLLYENFYEWLHSQSNFEEWYNGDKWAIDKDIIIKGNKVYSPETCCLVPQYINSLFTKCNSVRGDLPIGVCYREYDNCSYYISSVRKKEGGSLYKYFKSLNEAFLFYKKHKEDIIQQLATEEYAKGNITKQCYEAMMQYEVEIDD